MASSPSPRERIEQLRRELRRRFPDAVRVTAAGKLTGPPPAAETELRALDPVAVPRIRQVLPTGFPILDAMLPGGGLPRGQIVAIVGPASSGKLSVAFSTMAHLTSHGGRGAFIDTRGELFPPSAAACGIDLRRLLILRAPPPMAAQATGVLVESRAFPLAVLDLSGGGGLTEQQAARLGALCRAAKVTVLALGELPTLRPLSHAAPLTLRAVPHLEGTTIAVERGPVRATAQLRLTRYASYYLHTATQLRLAGPSPGRRR